MNNNKKSAKFKYGSSAIIFTVVFVAFVILINVLLSFIDSRTGGLYVDMTSKRLYEVSEASVNALEGVDKPIEIIFCQPKDKIADVDLLNPVRMLAESYENTFDNVSVIYKDKLSDVAYFNKFIKTSDDEINSYSIVVNCPSTGLSKIYGWENMYKYNTEGMPFAFDGENKFTSAFLSVARNDDNMLRAGLVTGHGEDTGHSVQHFLEDYGYEVSLVDLKTTDKQELAKYNVLLVCNPVVDFIGIGEAQSQTEIAQESGEVLTERSIPEQKNVNEIEKLRDYVTESFGNLFFFLDPNYANMPELFSLIEEGFGVRVSNLYPVVDYGTILGTSSYSSEDWRFLGSYSSENSGSGYNMHKAISTMGAANGPAFGISCLMDIPKTNIGAMEISPIVVTGKDAVVMTGSETLAAPGYPLMTLSKYAKLVDDKERCGNAVICASSAFLYELDSPALANADLFKHILAATGNDSIVADIEFKVLDESSIEVTSAVAEGMMKKLGIVVPVIIAVLGVAMFIKRKYL